MHDCIWSGETCNDSIRSGFQGLRMASAGFSHARLAHPTTLVCVGQRDGVPGAERIVDFHAHFLIFLETDMSRRCREDGSHVGIHIGASSDRHVLQLIQAGILPAFMRGVWFGEALMSESWWGRRSTCRTRPCPRARKGEIPARKLRQIGIDCRGQRRRCRDLQCSWIALP